MSTGITRRRLIQASSVLALHRVALGAPVAEITSAPFRVVIIRRPRCWRRASGRAVPVILARFLTDSDSRWQQLAHGPKKDSRHPQH
jgi:hypothetical protein